MLYIITAVHNRYKITEAFVYQLKRQKCQNFRLLLVDDGCTDGTADMVQRELPQSIILHGDGNLWWGGALHLAYRYLIQHKPEDCDEVMLANDDAILPNDYLTIGLKHLNKNPYSLITACGYSSNDGRLIDGPVNYDVRTGTAHRLNAGASGNCASTRALMMSFDTYYRIGGFHPLLLPHYASDYEYTIRASRKGIKILSFEDFQYTFDEGTTGYNTLKGIPLKRLFSKRSRFNPIYRLIFMLMVTPLYYIPANLFSGLYRAKKELNK